TGTGAPPGASSSCAALGQVLDEVDLGDHAHNLVTALDHDHLGVVEDVAQQGDARRRRDGRVVRLDQPVDGAVQAPFPFDQEVEQVRLGDDARQPAPLTLQHGQ